jgi:NAD(P)-dependent dehydrogenase (short-subunit alcohol dehydrogenase family)
MVCNFAGGTATRMCKVNMEECPEFPDVPIDVYDWGIDVNLKGPFYFAHAAAKQMRKQKSGLIINIGSISGVVGEANATLYSATKSAFNGFTKALALEVAMDNITINTINPGWVETPLAQNSLNSEEYQEVMEIIPQKRFVEPIEVAKLCEYLITDNAKGITGQSINLCAGLTCGC